MKETNTHARKTAALAAVLATMATFIMQGPFVGAEVSFTDDDWASVSTASPTFGWGSWGESRTMIADDAGNIIVSGAFVAVGNVVANNIAKWDGEYWSPLGSGIASRSLALAVDGDLIYATVSSQSEDGGDVRSYVTMWNGSTWSPLGEDFEGSFLVAGGKVSRRLARGFLDGVPPITVIDHRPSVFFRGMPAGHYRIDRTNDLWTWEPLATRYAGETGGIDFTDERFPQAAFYRAVPRGF